MTHFNNTPKDTTNTNTIDYPINETQPKDEFLKNIDSTLEVADGAIEFIREERLETETKITNLKNLINYEESLIASLKDSLTIKNILISSYEEDTEVLKEKIINIKDSLDHATHKCDTQCYPTIVRLNKENKQLMNHIDSLQTWVFYLDSLVISNRRLNKKFNLDEN